MRWHRRYAQGVITLVRAVSITVNALALLLVICWLFGELKSITLIGVGSFVLTLLIGLYWLPWYRARRTASS